MRHFSLADRILNEVDHALRAVAAPARATRPAPQGQGSAQPDDTERALAAGLMRVNHAGEIAAQALYRGQALVARDPALRAELLQSADEEHDHLAWCADRTAALGESTSLLAPLWYGGSFAIGALAGLAGDRISLGFLAETEKQVAEHLAGHLERLPRADADSRAVIEQMRSDELEHRRKATRLGAQALPSPVPRIMRALSGIMTRVAFRV